MVRQGIFTPGHVTFTEAQVSSAVTVRLLWGMMICRDRFRWVMLIHQVY